MKFACYTLACVSMVCALAFLFIDQPVDAGIFGFVSALYYAIARHA